MSFEALFTIAVLCMGAPEGKQECQKKLIECVLADKLDVYADNAITRCLVPKKDK